MAELAAHAPAMRRGPPHAKARSQHPEYPARAAVEDARVDWAEAWDAYAPPFHEDPALATAGWADPADPSHVDFAARVSFFNGFQLPLKTIAPGWDAGGAPLNPAGRTGLRGRGLLGKWGANHAADPIVTRIPEEGAVQVVVVKRKDTGEWALPGGMVDAGEHVSDAVKREFAEEAGAIEDPAQKALFEAEAAELFRDTSGVCYEGYVDDPRNTDNAWLETTAYHFHCQRPDALSRLAAGDDAAEVKWLDTADREAVRNLYANHAGFVEIAISRLAMARLAAVDSEWLQEHPGKGAKGGKGKAKRKR